MPLNYLSIDFETANEQRASACAVGVALVRNGELTHSESWFIQPPTGDRFTNTRIHGISAADVAGAPTWAETHAKIAQLAESFPVLAYSSPFDKSVYNAASAMSGFEPNPHVWRDILSLAKIKLDLPGYRLPAVMEHLGLGGFPHHSAGDDAVAAAKVLNAIAEREGLDSIDALWSIPELVKPPATRSFAYGKRSMPLPKPNPDADPRHILFDVGITFSGDLEGFSRDEARAAAAELGARVTSAPSKKTDIIVFGGFEPATLRPGAVTTSKIQKALDLRAAGHNIELLSESDFIALLNFDPDA